MANWSFKWITAAAIAMGSCSAFAQSGDSEFIPDILTGLRDYWKNEGIIYDREQAEKESAAAKQLKAELAVIAEMRSRIPPGQVTPYGQSLVLVQPKSPTVERARFGNYKVYSTGIVVGRDPVTGDYIIQNNLTNQNARRMSEVYAPYFVAEKIVATQIPMVDGKTIFISGSKYEQEIHRDGVGLRETFSRRLAFPVLHTYVSEDGKDTYYEWSAGYVFDQNQGGVVVLDNKPLPADSSGRVFHVGEIVVAPHIKDSRRDPDRTKMFVVIGKHQNGFVQTIQLHSSDDRRDPRLLLNLGDQTLVRSFHPDDLVKFVEEDLAKLTYLMRSGERRPILDQVPLGYTPEVGRQHFQLENGMAIRMDLRGSRCDTHLDSQTGAKFRSWLRGLLPF